MRCSAKFFGLRELPKLDIGKDALEALAEKSTSMGLTVPGVQKKLSLHLSDDGSSRLTLVGYPSGYILKPQTEGFEALPEAEDLTMDIAELMGVRTAPHGLIDLDGEAAYITKRADRAGGSIYAMEDFCQLSGRLSEDKYKGSYEKCAEVIKKYSTRAGFDLTEFFLRIVVCFVTGNSDMHLKNFSLIENTPGGRDYVLSPAYDLLPVNIVMPEDQEETALTLNGKKSRLRKEDFLAFAEKIGVNERAAVNIIKSVVSREKDAKALIRESYLTEEMKEAFIVLLEERVQRLQV